MRRLLEDILLYAKPLELRLAPLSVAEVVGRFVEDNRALVAPRRQELRLEGGSSPARIMADEHRLIQVLGNLTQNACEAAPEAAVITLSVTDDPAGGTLTVAVRNPGAPIPPELMGRIAEPFFSTKASGTGLGLAIVKRLTALQGGELSISSAEDTGTRVRLTFPRLELPTVSHQTAPTRTGSRSQKGAIGPG
jgi:signal transduction histidine kinase